MNQSVSRTTGMAPVNVSKENEELVFTKLYGYPVRLKQPTYKVGDLVLLSKRVNPLAVKGKSTFKKGYKANFTRESYVV